MFSSTIVSSIPIPKTELSLGMQCRGGRSWLMLLLLWLVEPMGEK